MSKTVTLVDSGDEPAARKSRSVTAYLKDGDLEIAGEDLGPTSRELFSSSSYEFWWTIPRQNIAAFMNRIGGDPLDPLGTLERHWSGEERFSQLQQHLSQAKETDEVCFWSWYSPD